MIELSTKTGDIVLDFNLGTGTTCAVAHKMGRQYIGIEQLDYGENDSVVRLQNVIGKRKKDSLIVEYKDYDKICLGFNRIEMTNFRLKKN